MNQNKELENEDITQEANLENEREEGKDMQETAIEENDNQPDTANTATSKLEQELAEQKDKYLRMYSEFENFRRRTAKEKLDMVKTANESMASALLPVIDDFERAMKSFEKEDKEESVQEGVQLIYNKLTKVLEQKGVAVMDLKPGDAFDAEYQEAITQIPAPDEKLKGKIVDVVEKGYLLGEKVIRFAREDAAMDNDNHLQILKYEKGAFASGGTPGGARVPAAPDGERPELAAPMARRTSSIFSPPASCACRALSKRATICFPSASAPISAPPKCVFAAKYLRA